MPPGKPGHPDSNRNATATYDRHQYKHRNLIERHFCRIKHFRRIATRYEKLAQRFASFVALVTAFGGRTLRDLLLYRSPLFWIEYDFYVMAILSLAFALVPGAGCVPPRVLLAVDALGLGSFTIAGASCALEAGTSLFIAALMGVITETFGGVMRDILCNEVPALFRQSPLYATCAFIGCPVYFGLLRTPLPPVAAVWLAIIGIVLFRRAAVRWYWTLPTARD